MVHAALDGSLRDVPTVADPVFGLHVPESCPNVPAEFLNPRNTWDDKDAYDRTATDLARMFRENFADYEDYVDDDVKAVNPSA
jgi:phosphoenolpyruvate carboxykinase (ATP)